MNASHQVLVLKGDNIAAYGFGDGHPFGPRRHQAFHDELQRRGLAARVRLASAGEATDEELALFHGSDYIRHVRERSEEGFGWLDEGDTPAQPGIDTAARAVVGASLYAAEQVMAGHARRAFVPIGGLHHAGRDHAAGFCVYNDCGVVIERLRRRHGLKRIAYVDIDAHHGDGVFHAYEDDPDVVVADIHEDGRWLYPGTGRAGETGLGAGRGSKLNLPMEPGAGDAEFRAAWAQAEAHIEAARPEFILLQCGADSLAGDPLAHLGFTPASHGLAAASLAALADRHCEGRLLALGGGGYDLGNLAAGWCAVVEALLAASGTAAGEGPVG